MPLMSPLSGGTWNIAILKAEYTTTGSPFLIPGYRKDSSGIVYLRGSASYVSGLGTTLLTLPTGFRPTARCRFTVPSLNSASQATVSIVDMLSEGDLIVASGASHRISFDQIFFATY